MIYRLLIILSIVVLLIFCCSRKPAINIDEIVDLSYAELKQKYGSCKGKGNMTAKGLFPWKLNYSFTTQNDSSYVQFKDFLGRRVLFVQSLPDETLLWDMQNNVKYDPENGNTIPIFDIIESIDLAQILWGEIPDKYMNNNESNITIDTAVNFESSATNLGMALDKVIINLESPETVVELKISQRKYGEVDTDLLSGIPKNIPLN